MSPALGPQGILPSHGGEAGEVAIGRAKRETVLDREGRQMGVRNQIPAEPAREEPGLDVPVALRRLWDPHGGAVEPLLDLVPG